MRKDIITWCVSILLLTSCAARKVDIVKNDTKITIDSAAIVKTDSVSTTNNNIHIVENSTELEVCPLSDTVPMVVNGITYKNARLTYKKVKKVSIDTTVKKTSKIALKTVIKSKKEVKSIKNKTVDKKANYFIYLWLLLIPIGMYIYRQIKNKIFL